jgi:hypothetical protein
MILYPGFLNDERKAFNWGKNHARRVRPLIVIKITFKYSLDYWECYNVIIYFSIHIPVT